MHALRRIVLTAVLCSLLSAAASAQVPRPAWFDEPYWQQLVFKSLELPEWREKSSTIIAPDDVTSLNFHISTTIPEGDPPLEQRWIDRYREVIPVLMRRFTGLPWAGAITVGPESDVRDGWVGIEFNKQGCGAASIQWPTGRRFGHGTIWLSTVGTTRSPDWCLKTVLLAHELGHVLGFSHVDDTDDVMCTDTTARGGDCNGYIWEDLPLDGDPTFTDRLLRHAQFAYSIGGRFPYPGVADPVPTLPFLSNAIDWLLGRR